MQNISYLLNLLKLQLVIFQDGYYINAFEKHLYIRL